MKRIDLILILFLVVGIESTFGQSIIQSTCLNETEIPNSEVVDFSYEIALSEMRDENHYYHDSILVPQLFVDSIKNFVTAYHNAIKLSESIIDYRTFQAHNNELGEIILTFDSNSECFYKQDNNLIITNDTLSNYIDSLNLFAQSWSDNKISLLDNNSKINIYGDFNFFYNISCITNIELIIAVTDRMPCYKSRSGDFKENKLEIVLSDVNYCETNSYSYNWIYSVNDNCQIEINSIPTSVDEEINDADIYIYPNPFDNVLNIESIKKIKSVKIIGLDGKIYFHEDILNDKFLNTSELRKGMYLIEMKYGKGLTYKKMIKK